MAPAVSPHAPGPCCSHLAGCCQGGGGGEWVLGPWVHGAGGGSRLTEQQGGPPRPGEASSSVAF